jgi:hypothetical protein
MPGIRGPLVAVALGATRIDKMIFLFRRTERDGYPDACAGREENIWTTRCRFG